MVMVNGRAAADIRYDGGEVARVYYDGASIWERATPTPMDNYEALAGMAGSFVVEFTAAIVGTPLSNARLFEHSPAAGTRIRSSPAGMYTDTSIYWLERLRFTGDETSPTFAAVIDIHRGASSVTTSEQAPFLQGSGFGMYIIDEDRHEYMVYSAEHPERIGGGFVNFTIGTGESPEANTERLLDHNLGVNPSLSVFGGFINGLPGNRVVVGLAPSGYTPTFS